VKPVFSEALRYLAASGGALGVDVSLLWVLVHFFAWDSLLAASASFLAGTCVAYALSVRLVFRERRLAARQNLEFAGFAALGALGLGVNALVMYLAMKYLGLFYLAAKCVASACTVVCNFVSRRQLLFVRNTVHVRSRQPN
jgi:putative flippase GtrA